MKQFLSFFLVLGFALSVIGQTVEGQLHVQGSDSLLIDAKGYLYSFIRSGSATSLGVAPGGNYVGKVTIPSAVRYQGVEYPVTAVRKNAMMCMQDDPNSAKLKQVFLPPTISIIGSDAFSGNTALELLTGGSDSMLIETRVVFRCPSFRDFYYCAPPLYAYTNPAGSKSDRQYFIHSTDDSTLYEQSYSWAFFKNRHNGIRSLGPRNFKNDDAIACWCSNLDRVRGYRFQLRNPANVTGMFSGYSSPGQDVVLLDNHFVATHHFPPFNRWCWGEPEVDMDADFVRQMERTYGRKVRYSKESGSIALDGMLRQVVVTEFAVSNNEAMVVVSWVVNGQVQCSWVETAVASPDYNPEEGGLWNVDDDGTWGIPTLLLVAEDDRGNVDLFLRHSAPETIEFIHLTQKGNTLVAAHNEHLYVLYE